MNIIVTIKSVVTFLVGLPIGLFIIALTLKLPIRIFTLIKNHVILTFTILALLTTGILLLKTIAQSIKKFINTKESFYVKLKSAITGCIRNWKLPLVAFSIYLYFAFVMGTSFSLTSIFNTMLPVKVFYSNTELAPDSNFKFPFWKTYKIRILNDIPIRKKIFPSFHYIVKQDFYRQYNKPEVHSKKIITCILKNIGSQPLLIKKINNIEIRRGNQIIDNKHFFSPTKIQITEATGVREIEITEWLEYLNLWNDIHPIILFPLEEIVLFNVKPDCYGSLLSMDVEIECVAFSEVSGTTNTHAYRQMDEVKFEQGSPRTLPAQTKYVNEKENQNR